MLIKTFKELVKDLSPETPVLCTCFKKDYTLKNPQVAEPFDLTHDGYFYFSTSNVFKPETKISDLLELKNDVTLQQDIEDGFIFRDIKSLEIVNNSVILFIE